MMWCLRGLVATGTLLLALIAGNARQVAIQ